MESGKLLMVSACATIVAIYFFKRCFTRYTCARIDPLKVEEIVNDARKEASNNEEKLTQKIRNDMSNSYLEAAKHNFIETESHSKSLHKLYTCFFVGAIPMLFCFLIILRRL